MNQISISDILSYFQTMKLDLHLSLGLQYCKHSARSHGLEGDVQFLRSRENWEELSREERQMYL